jgi:lipopolysaccharide transport system permease protein
MELNTPHQEWDLEIKPHDTVFNLHLKDVWNYRDLLWLLVRRDFVSFYKQTVLGPLWFFIQPIFTTIVFTFVFGKLAGIKTGAAPPALFYMAGTIAWNYFADCLTKTSTVFKDNANIFGKVYFPRLIMPLSIVVSNLVKFGVQFLLFIIVLGVYLVKYHFFGAKEPVDTKLVYAAIPGSYIFYGIAGAGAGAYYYSHDHQIPRPCFRGNIWHAVVNVCHPGYLPAFYRAGQIPRHY